ncbi:hypothetical protein GQ600_10403 [Phytophthora cactorum]|nr:hypothetical protein GQ600_10403 [Phytophthora cactorum]
MCAEVQCIYPCMVKNANAVAVRTCVLGVMRCGEMCRVDGICEQKFT